MNSLQQIIKLTSRLNRHAIRQKANRLLSLCIIVCSCIAASLSFFSSSVQTALDHDIANFLGAPLVVRSDQPLSFDLVPKIQGLQTPVTTSSFTTGAIGNKSYQSVSLKAVSPSYPLQGELMLRTESGEISVKGTRLTPNAAWLDRRAFDELNITLGEQIQIGSAWFKVTGEIVFEPDRLTQLQHALPRVMVSLEGLSQTGIGVNNDRGEYRALFTGDTPALTALEKALPNSLQQDYEVLKPGAGKHPFSRISLRAERLLNVVLALVLLMCGGAAATLADHSVRGYAVPATVLRCMGVNRHIVTLSLCLQLSALALLMSIIGCLLAWLIHPLLIAVMEPHMTLEAAQVKPADLLAPIGISMLMVVAFVVPKLQQLGSLPVISVLRGQFEAAKRTTFSIFFATIIVIGLLWFSSDNTQLTIMMIGAVVVLGCLSVGFGWVLSKLASQWHHLFRGPLKIAIRSIGRSPKRHSAPLTSVAIAMMAILMTITLRGSFLDVLQVQMLETDGNYIFTGLPEEHKYAFAETVNKNGAQLKGLYPTVSAKLVSINGLPIDQALKTESDTREESRSKVRLSWSKSTPANNLMRQGSWPALGSNEVSVEYEVMNDLGLSLGDQLGFKIGDTVLTSRISSTREYRAGGSRVMFWFMFAPDTLVTFEQSMMGGILVRENHQAVLSELNQSFPQTRITDLEKQIAGIRTIMIALTRLLNTTLLLLLGGALMVVVASSFANAANRQTRLSLMRALGLQRKHCYAMNVVEQLTIGLVASLVGIFGAQLIAGLMFHNLFALSYELDWARAVSLTAIISIAFAAFGWAFAFRKLQQPVKLSLTQ